MLFKSRAVCQYAISFYFSCDHTTPQNAVPHMQLKEWIEEWKKKMIASFVIVCHDREKILYQLVTVVVTLCVAGKAVTRLLVFD